MNLTISQQDLDSFKRRFPNDPDIQAITLDQLRTYAQSVDPTVPPAQRPHQIKRVTFSPCDTAIATLIWDCICIVGDIMPIRDSLRSTVFSEYPDEAPQDWRHGPAFYEKANIIKDSGANLAVRGLAVLRVVSLVYSWSLVEIIIKAIYKSLNPLDAVLYGTLALANCAAAFLTDGASLIGTVTANLVHATFLVEGAVNIVAYCGQEQLSGDTVAGRSDGKSGSHANELSEPMGVYVELITGDKQNGDIGYIFVSDSMNGRVQKWPAWAGEGTTFAGGLKQPEGICADAGGTLYVADPYSHAVMKYAPDGNYVGSVAALGAWNAPNMYHGVFVDSSGNVYISDAYLNMVEKYAPGSEAAGLGVRVAGGVGPPGSGPSQLIGPTGVFVDEKGNVYVADTANNRVQMWAPGASAGVTVAGRSDAKPGEDLNELKNPKGVFVDKAGNVFVADTYNHRVQKWAPGAIKGYTVAGGHGQGSNANQLNAPCAVFVDHIGNIYVADTMNHRVQRWQPYNL